MNSSNNDSDTSSKPQPELAPAGRAVLQGLAAKYIWWKTSEEAMIYPDRVAAQVMNIGDYDDVLAMIDATGEDYLREVLTHSEAGQLNARSWHYWHYRLGLAEFDTVPVPPLPARTFA